MRKITLTFLFFALLSCVTIAQKPKSWTEWTKKDVEKMLNDSAWGQTQTETDTSEMNVTFGVSGGTDGARNQAIDLKYHVMFFSAKPIREAFARKVLLDNPKIVPAQLQNFVDGDYSEVIVVAVTYESTDRRYTGPVDQAFRSATSATLKNKCYLERKDGKRIFLEEYAQQGSDGTGAQFVFPRMVDGKPFLTERNDSIRFVAEFSSKIRVDRKFKVSEMMYDGKLEY
jgi:hypothetical protein